MQAVFCCPKQFYFRLDNDYAGRMAAKALMAVLTKDYTVAVRLPPRGKDYNDYLCSGQGISAAKPKHAILYAMQFSIFARSLGLIAAEHPVKVAGIIKAAAIRNLRDRVFGGA